MRNLWKPSPCCPSGGNAGEKDSLKIDRRERLIGKQAGRNVGPVHEFDRREGKSGIRKFRKYGKLRRREGGSTTKHEILYILGKEWRKDLQEGKFQQKRQALLNGDPRIIEDPSILFDDGQKIFVIFGGEVLSGQEIDVFVVVVIEVGHIHGNEEGDE
jgi:hypothetical protein